MTCTFFGHRAIENSEKIKTKLLHIIEELVTKQGVDTFLFGSKSQFNTLCYEATGDIKKKYPNIKRIYVRAEYPLIDESYKAYILKDYEDTYYPKSIINAGKASYVKRNCEMIDKSSICVVYYSDNCLKSYKRNSGTKVAFEYAVRKNKKIINLAP